MAKLADDVRALTRWAQNADAGDVTDPDTSQELNGYLTNQRPPNDEANYIYRQLASCPPSYSTLEGALNNIRAGDVAIVDEDGDHAAFSEVWGVNVPAPRGISTDGERVYVVDGQNPAVAYAYSRADGTELWSRTLAGVAPFGPGQPISADGESVWVITNTPAIYRLNPVDGTITDSDTSTWSGTFKAVASDARGVIIAGDNVDGTNQAIRILPGDLGVADSVWNPTPQLNGVRIYDDVAWFAHDVDAGANFSARSASDLATAAPGEPPTSNVGADDSAHELIVTDSLVIVGLSGMAADEANVEAWPKWGAGLAGTTEIWANRLASGGTPPGVRALAWDGRDYIAVGTTDDATYGNLQFVDIRTGAPIRTFDLGAVNVTAMSSDGFAFFVGHDGAGDTLRRYHVSRGPRLIRRVQPGANIGQWHKLFRTGG